MGQVESTRVPELASWSRLMPRFWKQGRNVVKRIATALGMSVLLSLGGYSLMAATIPNTITVDEVVPCSNDDCSKKDTKHCSDATCTHSGQTCKVVTTS